MDIDAGERAVELIKPLVASTLRPEVLGGLGGFGGLFALDPDDRYGQPVLVAGTDGVGTKALVAQALGRFDTIGIDLVAMCVDDLVCQGAEPLFFLDYISSGAVDPAQMADLVSGVADGCRQVGAALLGGEMAEHAGVMKPGEFDLVGFAVGVVERDEILGPSRVRDGDVLIGLASPGLRCNGYTLARHVLLERAGRSSTPRRGPAPPTPWPTSCSGPRCSTPRRCGRPSGRPTSTPWPTSPGAASRATCPGRFPGGASGGGRPGHLAVPPIFGEIRRLGQVADDEMARVFNLGLGMVMVVDPGSAADALAALRGAPGSRRPWWAGWTRATVGWSSPGPAFWPDARRSPAPTFRCPPA